MPAQIKDLGPCVVVWDPDGDNISFQKTFGGVTFRYEELRAGIKEDQQGETDVDEVKTGVTNPELEVPLTREEVANLEYCFGNASAGASNLKVSNPVGGAVFADAKEVIVKPIVDGVVSVTASEWLHIHRAYPRINMELAYDNSGQRVFNTIFKGFPDDASGQVNEMFRIGEAS